MKAPILTALILLALGGFAHAQNYRTLEDLKNLEHFHQKLPKGSIASIDQPEYLPAAQAQVPETAWVLGVMVNGEAKAFSVNLLNKHSVVNDTIGGRPVSVVWGPFSNIAALYEREIDGQKLDFAVSGAIYHNAIVVFDKQTDSYWPIVSGAAIGGPSQGKQLKQLPAIRKTLFGLWKREFPNTQVLAVDGVTHIEENPYLNILSSADPFIPVKKVNKPFPPKKSIYGFSMDGKAYAIAHDKTEFGWQGKAGKSQVFFFRPKGASPFLSTLAYNLGSEKLKRGKDGRWVSKNNGAFNPITGAFEKGGVKAEPLTGVDTFWVVWSQFNKKVKVLNPSRRGHSEFQKEEGARIGADKPMIFGKN